jgi:hypothetical protein
MAETLDTPFGPLYILHGARARKYDGFHGYAEKYSKQKRVLASDVLFGEFQHTSNALHQGPANIGIRDILR